MTDNEVKWLIVGNLLRRNLMAGVEKEPVAYLYEDFSPDGSIFYELPEYDTETYPYLVLVIVTGRVSALASSTPFIRGATNSNISIPHLRSHPQTYDKANDPEKVVREQWLDWEVINERESITWMPSKLWANHDIFKTDETLFEAKGAEPVPVYLPILLYDKEVTTKESTSLGYSYNTLSVMLDFRYGDTLRVTFNGVVYDDVKVKLHGMQPYIGNVGISIEDEPDDGGDWFMYYLVSVLDGSVPPDRYVELITRTPGTYQLKIELIARAAECKGGFSL